MVWGLVPTDLKKSSVEIVVVPQPFLCHSANSTHVPLVPRFSNIVNPILGNMIVLAHLAPWEDSCLLAPVVLVICADKTLSRSA